MSPYALVRRGGLRDDQAARLVAGMQIGLRLATASLRQAELTASQIDIIEWARITLGHLIHEEMWILALDRNYGIRGTQRVSMGCSGGTATDVATVLRQVPELGATTFVLVHNHPSGNPEASEDDIDLTMAIWEGAKTIRVPLFDHIIVTPSGECSAIRAEELEYTGEEEEGD